MSDLLKPNNSPFNLPTTEDGRNRNIRRKDKSGEAYTEVGTESTGGLGAEEEVTTKRQQHRKES
jgi:hypothetical protein